MAEIEEVRESEIDRVVSWRLEQLLHAGLSFVLADEIARRLDLDWHLAARLGEQHVGTSLIRRIVL
jgi:hypothetical protein